MKRLPGFIVGIACSGFLLYLALRGVDLDETWRTMRSADLRWVVAIAFSTVFSNVVRTIRWGHLLEPVRAVPFAMRFRAVMLGDLGNQILPVRLGEALRAYSLTRSGGIPFTTVMTTQVVERILDIICVLLLLGTCLIFFPLPSDPDPRVSMAVRILALVTAVPILAVGASLVWRRPVSRWADGIVARLAAGRLARLAVLLRSLLDGLKSLGDGKQIGVLLLDSLALWGVFGLAFAFGIESLDLFPQDSYGTLAPATLVLVCVALFTMIPAAVGSLGTFQAGCIVALSVFGIAKDQALGYSVIVHSTQILTAVIIGSYYVATGFGDLAVLGTRRKDPRALDDAPRP